ncbi:mechanosensitive ion channel family protein [Cellulomonas xylanilytica]|uniref:Mechanosensitive ion channel protein MscS n=1 Tax=Cellulomonas xylanilytica TaxID=233583 RepID=A0A510V4E4_9CELL|nr:mechanosensitive ion channel domain-containing protein [Cellulomonas xylanilytica]GEK21743.1 mechanosensitive ion channel protein MscS [Cellulomonas xylanilytica]
MRPHLLPGAVDPAVADGVQGFVVPTVSLLAAVVVAYLAATLLAVLVRRLARRSAVAADLTRRSRKPMRAVLLVVAVWIALRLSTDPAGWTRTVEHVLLIALIITVAWLIGSLAFVLEDAALQRYRIDVADNRHARRVRTQVQVLRRITVAILVLCAIAAILLTFPSARTLGASLLASAGLISIVAGLAAQSSLANVFAGLQLAFTDAIRVDDVVVVADEWGRIEEITLTYVVVHVWDDRRLILPSTYFTTTPFENWTRRAADLLGTVELDLDWEVPVEALRTELTRLLQATDLWDRRVGILQVTDAVGGMVRIRALASAVDAPTLFDLRCYVREGLVGWLQREAPQSLPKTRWEGTAPTPATGRRAAARPDSAPTPVLPVPGAWSPDDTQTISTGGQDARLFTGSIEALERSRHFSGPGQDVIDEREQSAEDHGDGRQP